MSSNAPTCLAMLQDGLTLKMIFTCALNGTYKQNM